MDHSVNNIHAVKMVFCRKEILKTKYFLFSSFLIDIRTVFTEIHIVVIKLKIEKFSLGEKNSIKSIW